jgi:hypothetical protein
MTSLLKATIAAVAIFITPRAAATTPSMIVFDHIGPQDGAVPVIRFYSGRPTKGLLSFGLDTKTFGAIYKLVNDNCRSKAPRPMSFGTFAVTDTEHSSSQPACIILPNSMLQIIAAAQAHYRQTPTGMPETLAKLQTAIINLKD